MENQAVVVFITAPSMEAAQQIAKSLLEQKLAACVNLLSGVKSLYLWKGKLNEDEEVLMIAKTRQALFEDHFIPAVKAIHPYDLPEIISLPITAGSTAYLEWINQVTQ